MGFIKSQLLKVLEWEDTTHDTMVYKFPMQEKTEIMMGSQLIVRPSQVAIFVSSGKIADLFTQGRYKLDTENLPVLTKLRSWKYGFNSPFKCEVYFINTKQFLNTKWGTPNPVMMRDQDFGMVRFRAFGTFSFKVGDPIVFFKEVAGTLPEYKTGSLINQLKSIIISGIGEAIAASNIPALDLAMQLSRLSDDTRRIVLKRFSDMGIELSGLAIENISLPPEVEKSLDKRTSMSALGDVNRYTAFQAADSMRDIAQNAHKGSGGGIPAMGMGLGTGYAMTNMYAGGIQKSIDEGKAGAAVQSEIDKQAVEQKAKAEAEKTAEQNKEATCQACKAKNTKASKFCANCGAQMARTISCPDCGKELAASAKFCPECGRKISAKKLLCGKCGNEIPEGSKFCPYCGNKN